MPKKQQLQCLDGRQVLGRLHQAEVGGFSLLLQAVREAAPADKWAEEAGAAIDQCGRQMNSLNTAAVSALIKSMWGQQTARPRWSGQTGLTMANGTAMSIQ